MLLTLESEYLVGKIGKTQRKIHEALKKMIIIFKKLPPVEFTGIISIDLFLVSQSVRTGPLFSNGY